MKEAVYVIADNIVSPLGNTTAQNFQQLLQGNSGVQLHNDPSLAAAPFFGAIVPSEQVQNLASTFNLQGCTKFEQLSIASIQYALSQTNIDVKSPRVGFILSSTKGNIELLEAQQVQQPSQLHLTQAAQIIADKVGFTTTPIVLSNACISGLLAMLIAQRLVRAQQYDHVVVCGADVFTKFVLSGFQSFQAVSDTRCLPFDAERKGINLGEAAATVIVSKEIPPQAGKVFRLLEGASSNDANHISGPSRTGEELALAIQKAIEASGIERRDIGFVSAHGTATLYNDEMESKAFALAGLLDAPVNSLKGYYGHTLGAAGLLEAIVGMHAMDNNVVLPTLGFQTLGVSQPLHVPNVILQQPTNYYLKTTSGFGGCNAAMIFGKYETGA
ncbi:beta-ketoacyl synthase N-terminal-like domain-containing protein [Chitinophaga skermanii]|nr:beta-ketoacyl synthase N-terminal-like domain-containing protein [Chitinophaga skermanii]